MRRILVVLFIFFSSTLFSQVNTLGFFERKWSSHSTLEFFSDSTFAENYISFSCGLYASSMPDKNLRGSWKIDGDTLYLIYFSNNNEASFNLQKYLLFDNNNYLIPFGFSDAPFLYYFKTKIYDLKGSEIHPEQIINDYDSISSIENNFKSKEIRENLIKWFLFQNKKTTSDILLLDTNLFNGKQSSIIKDFFMISQIKYSLSNKKSKFNEYKINLFGLNSLLEFCEQNPNLIEKEDYIKYLISLKDKRKLKKWLKLKLTPSNKR